MSIRPMTTLAVCLGTLALQQAMPTPAAAQPIDVDGRAGDWRPADPRVSTFDDPRDIAAPDGGMLGDSGFDIRQLMLFVEPDGGLYAAYRTYGVAGDGDGDGDPDGGPGDGDREFVDLLIDLDENGVTDLVVSQSFVPLSDSVTIFAPNGSDLSADEARHIPMMGGLRVVDVFELTVPGFDHLLAARPNGDRSARYCVQAMLGSGNDGIGEDVIDGFSVGEECGGGGGGFIPVCPDLDAVELCNDFDDDCDLLIDEGLGLGDACTVGVGACGRTGVLVCAEDGGVVCDVPEGDPTPERCDGIDNDCDGMTDEDFPDLGLPCDVGLGACNAEGVLICAADGSDSICGGIDGQPLPPIPPMAERCNAIDDDCDGITDEGFPGLGDDCREGDGTCAVDGTLQCAADGLSLVCADEVGDPIDPVTPTVEQCNGVDEDCDGVIDEGIDGIGERCAVGVGACGSEGAMGCGQDGALICLAVAGDPSDELCDGVDNDCDGAVDERLDDCIMITGTAAGDCSVSPGAGDGSPLPTLLGLLLGGLLFARRRGLAAAALVALALTMAPAPAEAQDVQLFQPAAGVRGYLGVEGTRLAGEGVLVPTVHLQLASAPLVTRDRFDDELIADQDYVSRLFTMDLQLAYGLLDRLELTLDVPIHYTEGTLIEAEGADGSHLGDLRVGARVALLESGPGRPIGITLDLPVSLPTGDSDGFVGEGGVSASPAIAGEWDTGRVRIGSEIGVHLRSEDPQLGTLELSHELLFGLGAGIGLTAQLEALLEVAGRMPLTEVDPMSAASPVEGRAGLRWLDESGFAITGGAGTGFAYDYGAPRWRAFVGLGFVGDACGYDSDGDGIGDNCDRCPEVADAEQVDSDGDGVGDACDRCPMVADAEQTDTDGDGIGDVCDNCPAVANLEQGDLDEDALGDACDCTIEVGRVEFEFDKADIKGDQSFAVLDRMADILARYPEIRRVEVQGHTDTMGNRDYNRSLSKARAGEVSRYLGAKVQTAGLLACGYGEEQLAQWTPDETRNQVNRRVQFVILDLDPAAAGKRAMCPWPVKSDRCPDPVEADWVPNVDRTGQSAARGLQSAPRAGVEAPAPAPPPVDTLRPVEPAEGTTGRPRKGQPARPAPATRGGRSTAGRPTTDSATVWQPR